jgi:hypothetical protein
MPSKIDERNERISNWRGEPYVDEHMQNHMLKNNVTPAPISTQYDSDPGAWNPVIFKAIEDAGLWDKFTIILTNNLLYPMNKLEQMEAHMEDTKSVVLWYISAAYAVAKSTPAQKTSALVRALDEMEGK